MGYNLDTKALDRKVCLRLADKRRRNEKELNQLLASGGSVGALSQPAILQQISELIQKHIELYSIEHTNAMMESVSTGELSIEELRTEMHDSINRRVSSYYESNGAKLHGFLIPHFENSVVGTTSLQ